MEPDLKEYKSLMIVKQADMYFMVDFMKWAAEWAKDNGYDGQIRNTPEGYYELLGKLKIYKYENKTVS